LSENPNVTVLLLEAGPWDSQFLKPSLKIPGGCVHASGPYSYVDWQYTTKPSNNSLKSLTRSYPRGKVLGGCGSTNWLQFVRGHPADYDEWATQHGGKGWSYDDVLPYFKKLESFTPLKGEKLDTKYRGDKGPIKVRYPHKISPTTRAFVEAGVQCGYKENPDYNGENHEGFSVTQQNIAENSVRSSSTEYIVPNLSRKNLAVSTLSHVTRIIFEGDQAVGVEFLRSGQVIRVNATKEIILSAGAIGSPQILMVSGVGPRKHLDEMGIPVVKDLPVGLNLHDHPIMSLEYKTDYYGLRQDEMEELQYVVRYYMGEHNWLSGSPVQGVGFVHTDGNTLPYPDIQIHFLPGQMPCRTAKQLFGFKDCDVALDNPDALGFIVVLLHEKSIGSVKLRSKSALDDPIIDLNFLDHPYDKETLLKGIRITQKLVQSKAFDKYRGKLKVMPGVPFPVDSDEYWNYMLEHYATHIFHPLGTCKMDSDGTGVVDHQLKVKGLRGIRVVDLSVVPTQLSGNTNAAAMMIGEKAADMILAERFA
jgi:choline dehydrogenase